MPYLTALETSQLAPILKTISKPDRNNKSRDFNRAGRYGIRNQISLYMPISDFCMPRFIAISVSSFANIRVISVQLGYLCFLGDDNFGFYQARFVTRSPKLFGVVAFRFFSDESFTYARRSALCFARIF